MKGDGLWKVLVSSHHLNETRRSVNHLTILHQLNETGRSVYGGVIFKPFKQNGTFC